MSQVLYVIIRAFTVPTRYTPTGTQPLGAVVSRSTWQVIHIPFQKKMIAMLIDLIFTNSCLSYLTYALFPRFAQLLHSPGPPNGP